MGDFVHRVFFLSIGYSFYSPLTLGFLATTKGTIPGLLGIRKRWRTEPCANPITSRTMIKIIIYVDVKEKVKKKEKLCATFWYPISFYTQLYIAWKKKRRYIVLTLTLASVRFVHMAISSLVLMSGYRFLVNVASSSWSCCEVKWVLCLLCLFVFLLFFMLVSLTSSATTPTPGSIPSVFMPVVPIVSVRPVRIITCYALYTLYPRWHTKHNFLKNKFHKVK